MFISCCSFHLYQYLLVFASPGIILANGAYVGAHNPTTTIKSILIQLQSGDH
jgi:hypothetical protein